LHSTAEDGISQTSIAPEVSDMASLVTTSTLQAVAEESNIMSRNGSDESGTAAEPKQQPAHLTAVSVSPTISIRGKPATVFPMEVVRTTWEGRDGTDMAACLSGALVKTSNVSLLAPPAVLAELGLHKAALATLAGQVLPQLWPGHGTAAVFTSSMYKSGPKLSAKELKAALDKHHASLLVLPSCLHVPDAAAHRVRVALTNVMSMTTGTAVRRGGEVADIVDAFTHAAELAVDVEQVVNEKHPELCAGVEGSSFRLRFAGFGGASSLAAASPNHIWVYTAVADDGRLCDQALTAE
jgi:hypothetical protein